MSRNFNDLVRARWEKGFHSCLGLDSAFDKIPACVKDRTRDNGTAIFEFNRSIIDATWPRVGAYKPNLGFYLQEGWRGVQALEMTCDYIRERAPEIPIILDTKSGDIGGSNEAYAKFAFAVCGADALTLHSYLGGDSLKPFESYEGKTLIPLALTSNPGAGEFQNLPVLLNRQQLAETFGVEVAAHILRRKGLVGAETLLPLHQVVAGRVAAHWNSNGNFWVVAGATYPNEVAAIRENAPDIGLLLPGFGKQGASIKDTIPVAKDSSGHGFLANSSSGIIFASPNEDFAEAASQKLDNFNREIAEALAM